MSQCQICLVEHQIAVPCVHSNGTSGEELLAQLQGAVDATQDLVMALNGAYPNGRDHYLTGTHQKAIKEHCLRHEKLLEIAAELVTMRDHVQESINLKAEAKRSFNRA